MKTKRPSIVGALAGLAVLAVSATSPAGAQTTLTPAQKAVATALRDACRADYTRSCDGVRPGEGRILACFETHAADLSPGCKAALVAARAERASLK